MQNCLAGGLVLLKSNKEYVQKKIIDFSFQVLVQLTILSEQLELINQVAISLYKHPDSSTSSSSTCYSMWQKGQQSQ